MTCEELDWETIGVDETVEEELMELDIEEQLEELEEVEVWETATVVEVLEEEPFD